MPDLNTKVIDKKIVIGEAAKEAAYIKAAAKLDATMRAYLKMGEHSNGLNSANSSRA